MKIARSVGRPLRIDEMGSISCGGDRGVSDAFTSALWSLDALFAMANVGISGVNIHTVPNAVNQLFSFNQAGGRWEGHVDPDYYGLLMFAEAAPAGSQLLQISGTTTGAVRAWATRGTDGTIRVVLINTHASGSEPVAVSVPAAAGNASLEFLTAPSLGSKTGVTLGGQSFGAETTTGELAGAPTTTTVAPTGSSYSVSLPASSAALLTFPKT